MKKAVLIMPLSDLPNPGLVRVGEVGHVFGVELYEYYINLESNDLESEELTYVNDIKDLCCATCSKGMVKIQGE